MLRLLCASVDGMNIALCTQEFYAKMERGYPYPNGAVGEDLSKHNNDLATADCTLPEFPDTVNDV